MAENIIGYYTGETIRLSVGSPASNFVFSERSESFMIDNIGSNPVYFNFNEAANTGSTSGIVPAGEARSFDLRIGSVSVLASGGSCEVQVVRLS